MCSPWDVQPSTRSELIASLQINHKKGIESKIIQQVFTHFWVDFDLNKLEQTCDLIIAMNNRESNLSTLDLSYGLFKIWFNIESLWLYIES